MDDGIFMILFSLLALILLGGGYYACVVLNRIGATWKRTISCADRPPHRHPPSAPR